MNYEKVLLEDNKLTEDFEAEKSQETLNETCHLNYAYVLNESENFVERILLQEGTAAAFAEKFQHLFDDFKDEHEVTDDFQTDINGFVTNWKIRDNYDAEKANGSTQMFLHNKKECKDAITFQNEIKWLAKHYPQFKRLNYFITKRPWVLKYVCEKYFNENYNIRKAGIYANKNDLKSVGATNLTSPMNKTV